MVTAGGITGLLGLGGYHQRRRLGRWSDRDDLRTARDLETPDPFLSASLTVTDSHLESALADLENLVGNARAASSGLEYEEQPQPVIDRTESRFEDARSVREEIAGELDEFAALSNEERLDRLEELRGALRGAGQALALAELERGECDPDAIDTALDALRDDYESVGRELDYYASDVSRAVVAYGELDELLEDVRVAINAGQRDLREAPPRSYARVPYGHARLDDVERFAEHLERDAADGADPELVGDRLNDRYLALRERTDSTLEEVDFEYDDEVSSYAMDLWLDRIARQSDGSDEHDEGRLALATRIAAKRYAHALSVEAFEDDRTLGFLDQLPADGFDTTGADVREAKRRAGDALDDRLEADGDDRLVRYLCVGVADELEWQDRRLELALDDINDADSQEWSIELERLHRGYLEIAELAAVLPEASAVVEEE
ncbi:hypothetical protein CV102_15660 [Natronococcus pandeyae]|uniref:Uncharacterized protein n=1 Tax=Natronococcus pandeyae TaxID=2055836 RepID=A0A8J8Q3H2_9EURY|nr:hypothetical protein CV102_15660 [Natronococcus pandeyae]